ncbi:MAG: gamma-glutamyltransferase [Bacteroidetes bacterium]|nr:gamma-glutamyltransferase [Bacteroidota bacterium]
MTKFYSLKRITVIILLISLLLLSSNEIVEAETAQPVRAKNGMVVTASDIASKIGVEILKKGGNAVDAAVAVGFALAVTYPFAGNIGGGGFMVIHLKDGTNTAIDYREKAPLSASRDMYLDKNGNYISSMSKEGVTSVGVPGSVAGLIYALKKYGTMPLNEVIQPAINLAVKGWRLDDASVKSLNQFANDFKKYPAAYKIYANNGKPFKEGDLFVQKDLGWALNQIKEKGVEGFYKGKVASLLIKTMKEYGGYITQADLDKYKPVERKPIIGTYRGYEIVSMPPSSSGGIALVELLNILENYKFKPEDWGGSYYIHALVEAMKYVYADRTNYLGDEDFYPVPKKGLLSKEYAKSIFEKITDKATPADEIKKTNPIKYNESNETTHYSIYDKQGNAVSVTTTLNSAYGNKMVVNGAGFLLNNEMDDFSAKPGVPNQFGLRGSEANSIQPEKRMLSSMTPTIVLKNNKPYIIIGSPGGSTIITVVLQVIMNCIDFNMNIQEAIDAPRIHDQWLPDMIYHEKFAINPDTKEKLIKMGYKLSDLNKTFPIIGKAEGIMIDKDGIIYGAADPRGSGTAEGY